MRNIKFPLLLTFILLMFHCGQITSSDEDSDFNFSVKVTTPSNRPLTGLYVHAWNKIHFSSFKNPRKQPITSNATTTIMFDLIDDTEVDLTLKNLRNETVLNIFQQEFFNNGRYSISPSIQSNNALAIFKCLIEVRDLKQHLLYFTDSTYMVLYQPLLPFTELGKTDYQGRYSTTDSLKFPSILNNLPELVHTDIHSHVPQGRIIISDSITIVAWDPHSNLSQKYHNKIQQGYNHFDLVWDIQSSTPLIKDSMIPVPGQTKYTLKSEDLEIFQDRLYQNFPNPFN